MGDASLPAKIIVGVMIVGVCALGLGSLIVTSLIVAHPSIVAGVIDG